MSYIIPTEEITLTDRKKFVNDAVEAGINRALKLAIANSREELVVREGLPLVDFALAIAREEWLSAALVVATMSIYVNTALNANQVAVFYKVGIEEATPAVSQVWFQRGAGGRTTLGLFHIECLYHKLHSDGFLSEPMVYDRNETVFIQLYPRRTAAGGNRVYLGNLVIEPVGGVVS